MIVHFEIKQIKRTLFFIFFVLYSFILPAQRKMEMLDRGLVAIKVEQGIFLSWRIYGTEWYNTSYNLYRDCKKLNDTPLEVSNFSNQTGTLNSTYTVAAFDFDEDRKAEVFMSKSEGSKIKNDYINFLK